MTEKILVSYNDSEAETTFEASFIPAESWNGAAMPFFTKAEAARIAEDCETHPSSTFYRFHNGTFQEDIAFEETMDVQKWVDVETMIDPETGETLYRMGDGWTWYEISVDYDPEYDPDLVENVAELRAAVAKLQADFAATPVSELHFPGAAELTA